MWNVKKLLDLMQHCNTSAIQYLTFYPTFFESPRCYLNDIFLMSILRKATGQMKSLSSGKKRLWKRFLFLGYGWVIWNTIIICELWNPHCQSFWEECLEEYENAIYPRGVKNFPHPTGKEKSAFNEAYTLFCSSDTKIRKWPGFLRNRFQS